MADYWATGRVWWDGTGDYPSCISGNVLQLQKNSGWLCLYPLFTSGEFDEDVMDIALNDGTVKEVLLMEWPSGYISAFGGYFEKLSVQTDGGVKYPFEYSFYHQTDVTASSYIGYTNLGGCEWWDTNYQFPSLCEWNHTGANWMPKVFGPYPRDFESDVYVTEVTQLRYFGDSGKSIGIAWKANPFTLPAWPYETDLYWTGIDGAGNMKTPVSLECGKRGFCFNRAGQAAKILYNTDTLGYSFWTTDMTADGPGVWQQEVPGYYSSYTQGDRFIQYTEDGRFIAVGSNDYSWQIEAGQPVVKINLWGHLTARPGYPGVGGLGIRTVLVQNVGGSSWQVQFTNTFFNCDVNAIKQCGLPFNVPNNQIYRMFETQQQLYVNFISSTAAYVAGYGIYTNGNNEGVHLTETLSYGLYKIEWDGIDADDIDIWIVTTLWEPTDDPNTYYHLLEMFKRTIYSNASSISYPSYNKGNANMYLVPMSRTSLAIPDFDVPNPYGAYATVPSTVSQNMVKVAIGAEDVSTEIVVGFDGFDGMPGLSALGGRDSP